MAERTRVRIGENLVGFMFHRAQKYVENIRDTWVQALKPKPPLSIHSPYRWWLAYLLVGSVVWFVWPPGKSFPTEIWIGVFSFEGLAAALLASVAPATITEGLIPASVALWLGLDPRYGEQIVEAFRRWREDPTLGTNPSAFRNSVIVALYSLFWLPMVMVLSPKWSAAIMAASLVWTARRILSDSFMFFMPEISALLPRLYWLARSEHEALAYCPICKDAPQPVAWPPARTDRPPSDMHEGVSTDSQATD